MTNFSNGPPAINVLHSPSSKLARHFQQTFDSIDPNGRPIFFRQQSFELKFWQATPQLLAGMIQKRGIQKRQGRSPKSPLNYCTIPNGMHKWVPSSTLDVAAAEPSYEMHCHSTATISLAIVNAGLGVMVGAKINLHKVTFNVEGKIVKSRQSWVGE